jgi:hypothetical protein
MQNAMPHDFFRIAMLRRRAKADNMPSAGARFATN